jgi:hypothetical protein
VAALIQSELNENTEILEGARGEFTVWVGDECVAKKDADGFPADSAIVEAVRRRLEATGAGRAMRS